MADYQSSVLSIGVRWCPLKSARVRWSSSVFTGNQGWGVVNRSRFAVNGAGFSMNGAEITANADRFMVNASPFMENGGQFMKNRGRFMASAGDGVDVPSQLG